MRYHSILSSSGVLMQERVFRAGEVIFNEGERSDVAYHVLSGDVDIYRRFEGGTVQLGKVGEGELFGEMGIIDEQPRSACAAAINDVKVRVISKDTLSLLLERQPDVIPLIIRVLMERLRNTNQQIASFAAFTQSQKQYEIKDPTKAPNLNKVTLFPVSDAMKVLLPERGIAISSFPYRVGALPQGVEPNPLDWNNLYVEGADTELMSRNHFVLMRTESGLILSDRGSKAGTTVNGVALGGGALEYQASLCVGENEVWIGPVGSPYQMILYWE